MDEEYMQQLELVKGSDDSLYPDWLFEPFLYDFGDGYYEKSFVNDELAAMAKKLRRRYNDFFEWMEAMDIYNSYMDVLIEKYGSETLVHRLAEAEMMVEVVPVKPKLKNNKKNRQFLRSGIVPSRSFSETPLTNEEMLAIARQTFPNETGQNITDEELSRDLTKKEKRHLKEVQDEMAAVSRRKNLYRTVGNNAGTDFIVEYLNRSKQGIYDSSGRYKGDEYEGGISLADIVDEMEYVENTPPELLEDESANTTTLVNGRLVNKREFQRMEIYKELYQQGIDIIGHLGRSMDKKAVKMIRTEIGATEPMTKKELKKMKRRARKDEEKIARRRDANSLLEETLLGNKLSVTRDSNGNLGLRLKDLYAGDD